MADPLSVSASIAGLVTLADIVFRRTYRYAKAAKKAQKEISALSTEIGALYGILSNLHLVSRQLEGELFESTTRTHHIHSCYQTLEHVKSILDRDDTSALRDERVESLKRNLRWPFRSSEVKDLLAEIERHKTTLGLALNVDSMSGLLQALSKHDQIFNAIEGIRTEIKERHEAETRIAINKEKQDILNSFTRADPRSNHEMSRKLRSPGTGLWLTEGQEFRQWLEIKNAKLWLYGIPGAGKTVLASSMIEEALRISSTSTAVAFFYCDYKNADTQDLSNLLGSLAQQFAKQDEESFAKLLEFYETHNPEHRFDFKYDSEDLLDLVRAVTSVFDCAMIIVDGLDECGTNTPWVVDSLVTLNEGGDSTVKTIILSRDEIEIRERLEDFTKLSIAARSSDLRLYVGAEIELRTRKKRLRIRDQSLKEHILERLVEGAEGMFRWVTCQMDYLCELPNDAARRKALDCLPPDLNSTYERILCRINQSNPETQKLVRRALRWIANASKMYSFTIRALCEAVSVDFGSTKRNPEAIPDKFEILHWCSSLVRRSAYGEELELAHFTVLEYLEQIDPTRDVSISAYRICRKTDMITLSKVCLTYLNFEDFEKGVLPDLDLITHRLREYPFREGAIGWSIDFRDFQYFESDVELVSLAQKLWSPSKPNTFITWMYDTTTTVYGDWPEDEKNLSLVISGFAETTALHWMAMHGNGSMCSWLIESGCDINRSSAFGTPLHCALLGFNAYSNSISKFVEGPPLYDESSKDVVDILLEAGAEINCYYEWGPDKLSTLFVALLTGTRDIVLRLLDEGGVLDDRCLDMLESHVEDEEICDIVKHANEHNVEPDRCVRLLELALKAGTPNARGLISKHDDFPLDSTHYEQILRTAAEVGQVEIVKRLLENQKLDVDAPEEVTGFTGLHNAARTDQLEVTQTLMGSGADLSRSDRQGRTALHHSLHGRDLSCLQYFLDKGTDTGLRSLDSMTIWHLAAQDGNVQALKVLLSRPEDSTSAIDLKSKDGRTPLLFASASKSKEAVSLLLDAGSSITETASDGSSSLHYAVKSGSLEVVNFLIEKGVDPCAVTKDGSNAIHYAVRWHGEKTAEIVSLLLEQGVDPRKTCDEERTPLQDIVRIIREGEGSLSPNVLDWLFPAGRVLLKSLLDKSRIASDIQLGSELVYLVCWYSHCFPSAEETVSALLDFGPDVNAQFDDGKTSLMAAAQRGNGAILSNLIRHGADPCINASGLNALMFACLDGHTDIVIRLRGTEIDWNSKMKADIFEEQRTEVTALHLAAANGNNSILEYLLTEGLVPNINARTGSGETPLFFAAWSGESRNVSILLSNHSDSTCLDNLGNSAAHIAAEHGHADVISKLMRHGSDLGVQNKSGLTPELLARKMGHEVLAETIMDYVNEQNNDPNDGHNSRISHDTSEALKIAIDLGDLQLCTRLVEGGTNLDTGLESCMGCTPLLYALWFRQDAIAEYLISRDASIAGSACELWSTRGFTVFHYAAIWNPELLRLLFEKAPSEIYVIHDPIHPIHLAVFRGDTDCVKLILDHASQGKGRTPSDQLGTSHEAVDRMVNMQVRGDMLRWSWYATSKENFPKALETARPLHIAAYKGHLPIVRMLLAYGAFVDCEDTNLATPLHYALYNSQCSMVQSLLDAGANPNAMDLYLNSPCIVAAGHDDADALRILLEGGADIQIRNRYGETILHVAAISGTKNVFVFLCNDASVHYLSAENARGRTILLEAVCNAWIPMNYLVNLAPPAEAYESREYNILTSATTYRSTAEIRMLLRRIPTKCLPKLLNYRARNGTPLDNAAIMSKLDTMTLLLDFGAQLEAEGSSDGTPLMAACATGRLAAVKLLVARGAKTSYVKDGQVYSAYTAAKYHPKVRRWLLVGRFSEGPKLLTQRTEEARCG